MASTFELIASQTLGSNTASVTFSSIPATYDDLVLVMSVRTARVASNDGLKARFNGAASDTSHSGRELVGDGSSTYSFSQSFVRAGWCSAANNTANTFGSCEVYIPNYAGSTYKSVSATGAGETNATAIDMGAAAGLWSSTSAITQIEILSVTASNLVTGSSFYLYGVTHA